MSKRTLFPPLPEAVPKIRVILKTECLDHNPEVEMESIKTLIESMLDESQHFQFTFVREIMVVKK